MGDGSFKTAIWNAAATHLSERFPNQKGPMKTAEMCKGKVTSLKTVLRDINLWHAHSGKHWDNSNGANIAMEDEEKDFQDWMGSQPGNSMHLFKNSGWSLLEGMEVLFPNDQACGMCMYHPTTAKNAPRPSLSTNPPSTTSSNPVIMPPPSTSLHFTAAWLDASPSVNTGDLIDGMPIEKEITPMQPPIFSHQIYPSHLTVPAPPSTTAFLTPQALPSTTSSISLSRKCTYPADNTGIQTGVLQFPSAEVALQSLSLREDTECLSKRSRKNKEQSTPAVLIGMQGSLTYLGSIIDSSSPVTVQQRRAEHMCTALQVLEEQDSDLPVVAQAALMEVSL
ncbi:hypothetical protein F5141DRAFT_1222035 [Pisolithus sp. B1]|nr:hypothetical protein F5141DRAFT_1222035 [Pisolithus sp. B1]